MSHSEKNKNTSLPAIGKFCTSRRNAILGSVGLAASCMAVRAAESPVESAKNGAHCETTSTSLSDFINQFKHELPVPVAAKEGLAKVGDINLWYRDTGGDGEAVVLVHPTNLSGHCWGYQEKSFSEAGYRVISYSRRGYLGSDRGPEDNKPDAVEDLLGFVDFLKLKRFHLVSAAGGGAVAAGYASRLADDKRLASLVVACSLAIFEKTPDGKIVINKKFKEFPSTDPKYLFGLGTSYRDVNPAGVQKWKDMNKEATGDVKLSLKTIQPFGANSTLEEFKKISAPSLYISGSADLFCTPALMGEYYYNTPNAKFEIMNGAGHTAFWEAPATFDKIVLDHLANNRA